MSATMTLWRAPPRRPARCCPPPARNDPPAPARPALTALPATLLAACVLAVSGMAHAAPPRLPTTVEPRTSAPPRERGLQYGCAAEVEAERPSIYAPAGADDVPVTLTDIEISGGTVYTHAELEPYYAHLRNASTTLAQLYAAGQAIQDRYRGDGYLLTRVNVPPQRIENGIFRLEIIEGYIGRVRVDGAAAGLDPWIRAYLAPLVQSNGTAPPRPLTRRELERTLLLVDDLPGVTLRAVLRPPEREAGAARGESELVLRVERARFDGAFLANNRGSLFTGPTRAMFIGRENSALEWRESVELQLMSTVGDDEQRFGALVYRQPIGIRGLAATVSASYGPSQPGDTLSALDMETLASSAGAAFSYPLVLERRRGLYVEGGFEASSLDVDALGSDFSHDDLRVFHVGTHYDFADCSGGTSSVALAVRQGIDGLGASSNDDPERSRLDGRSDFTSVQLLVSHQRPVARVLGLYVAAKAQYAFDTLLSDEEFLLGGELFGRGYDSAELTGEHGVGVTAELSYSRTTGRRGIGAHQTYLYYDGGVVWNEDPGLEDHESLASAGVGIRVRFFERFDVALEIAQPLTRDVAAEGDRDPRVFLQLTTRR